MRHRGKWAEYQAPMIPPSSPGDTQRGERGMAVPPSREVGRVPAPRVLPDEHSDAPVRTEAEARDPQAMKGPVREAAHLATFAGSAHSIWLLPHAGKPLLVGVIAVGLDQSRPASSKPMPSGLLNMLSG